MKKKEKKLPATDSSTISTLLGRDTAFEGTLSFRETIRVDGRISGKLISQDGTVIVGENAVLEADVQVAVAIIRGKVTGRIEAKQRVEIYAPAQVNGDILAPTLAMDSGVVFNGNCRMQSQASPVAAPPKQPAVEPSDKDMAGQKN